jgi:hypothetical protein
MVAVILVILCTFALLSFVVHKIDLKRFRASGELGWKRVSFTVEADAKDTPDGHQALPEGKGAAP